MTQILALMGSTLEPDIRNEAEHEIRHQYLDASRARETLRWSLTYALEDGPRRTIECYPQELTWRPAPLRPAYGGVQLQAIAANITSASAGQ